MKSTYVQDVEINTVVYNINESVFAGIGNMDEILELAKIIAFLTSIL
jgi:hypothetical protein